MASKLATNCCNIGYDVLTICISIADVTTDIIVLIDFYNKDRMTFFAISLVILILAQCSYAMACAVRFDTFANWRSHTAFVAFCCMLPFGTLVAFFMYFASEESGFDCFREFITSDLSLDGSSLFDVRQRDSNLVKWIKKKLDKHLGFILEAAIEAFPQSLLQIIAIVYYQEANYVSIISILLSMFSVITKSLILSQGVEKYTFIWTWLCVVTDFFGIFFTLTWVFYSHDSIHGDFMGYFNIFGQIWIYKFVISSLFPVAIGLFVFFGFVYLFVYCGILFDTRDPASTLIKCGRGCLWFVFAPIMALLCGFAACLAFEVFCFSFFASAVYLFGTYRIEQHTSKHTSELVGLIFDFIFDGDDKCLRVLSINKGLNARDHKKCTTICKFIDKTLNEESYAGLQKITYADIRHNCINPKAAAFFADFFGEMMNEIKRSKSKICDSHRDTFDNFWDFIGFGMAASLLFWVIPVLLLSKIVQILYPWMIVIYLGWNHLLFSESIDLFQLVMLFVSIGLQLIIILLGIHVMRIHWYLWHVEPGIEYLYWRKINAVRLRKEVHSFYDNVCWYPQVEPIVMNSFLGSDIGRIVMEYCRSIQLVKQLLP
eukprot:823201_1